MIVVDPPQRERIRDDLKGIVKGELLFDDLSRMLYSTDASIFEVQPAGVVVPRDEEDVQALVRYAGEHQVPLIARGAGTGVAGESLGAGLIVDLSKHFRAILEVGARYGARPAGRGLSRPGASSWRGSAGASRPTRPAPNAPSAACWPPTPPAPAPSVTATPAITSSASASSSTAAMPPRSAGNRVGPTTEATHGRLRGHRFLRRHPARAERRD